MALNTHIAELSEKHRKLDQEIQEALRHPAIDQTHITELKREKLRLKDEIERLRHSIH